jgi:integrase
MTKRIINDPVAQEWLDSQKRSTKSIYGGKWVQFAEFTKMTGHEILASRKEDKDAFWEKKVLQFKTYLQEKGYAPYTTTTGVMAIRGFFGYYRLPLQYRRTESKRAGERSRKTEDYRFTLDDLRKLYEIADLTEKYVITLGKSLGLRAGDFIRLTRGDLEPYINHEAPISIGRYNTEKEGVYAYPFIDSDSQPIVKLMLEKMTREGRTKASDKILKYSDGIQLSRVIKRCVQKAGINVGGKQVRFHNLRKFLSDHLSSVMSESKWKQIVGKTVYEGAYISPDTLREDYKRVMTETNFTTNLDDKARQAAKAEFERRFTPEEREFIQKHGTMRFLKKKAKEKTEDCPDGEHCQRVIGEAELPELLAQGWRATIQLASGKIVISR